jgi:serine/threonine-protein kinase
MSDLLPRLTAALADRYRFERPLGAGGMALVYLAEDLRHHRKVAVKVLRPELAGAMGPERFLREIEIAAGLHHPHILPLYDSGDADGLLYYVMPLVEGESLRDRLTREKQLPMNEALQIAREAADALSYAHSRRVIHRDIKPENVLLESGHAVVTDFGIARAITAAGGAELTKTGIAVGTPAYMSPEQASGGRDLDGRSDIYALGCVLYEMLAGEPPFTGPTPQAIVARALTESPRPLQIVRETVPAAIAASIRKAMARTPADRFATAAQFADALAASPSDASGRGQGSSWLTTTPRIRLAIGALLLVGAAWAIVTRFSRPPVPVSPTRIAVFPFSVRGSGTIAYLAEGFVDLLSRNLDGVADLRSVDPATVLTTVAKSGGSAVLDAERGRAVARRLGAGLYVLGSVLAAGGRLRIQAMVYEQEPAPSAAVPQASVEGDTSELFELVDHLSRDLLVGRSRGVGMRLAQTAAVTTHSLPALKAYLDAERELRAGEEHFDSAVAGFQRATTEDSSFALAYYRLAVAAGWAGRWSVVGPAATRALSLGNRLADRERRLLLAYDAFRRGAAEDGERQYRAILGDHPDDLETEFELANLLYHYNPPRGRPRAEAQELFERVLAIDPTFLCPI